MMISGINLPLRSEPMEEMEASAEMRCGSLEEQGVPESWEVEDLEKRMKNLSVPSGASGGVSKVGDIPLEEASGSIAMSLPENIGATIKGLNQVDQFLREALQNPRDRLTILRMEQDIEKFIRNPKEQQFEFQQMSTSYLRLVAHRVAQHYCLQSVLVVDCNSSDGRSSRIVARKTPEIRYPAIRLADIPVSLPQNEKTNVVKFAIKRRPQKGSQTSIGVSIYSSKPNSARSVEERKEEYSKARARIFNSSIGDLAGKSVEDESAALDNWKLDSMGYLKSEKPSGDDLHNNHSKELPECSVGSSRINTCKEESQHIGRAKVNSNRVAIFRDREKDRTDPDYDRSYDRYAQHFDPGFGLNFGPFSMQALYAPFGNYNTEFSQLGALQRAQIHTELPPLAVSSYLHGPWVSPPNSMGYFCPDTLMGSFDHGHMRAHSPSAMYLHSTQLAGPSAALSYAHPQEQFPESLAQPHLHEHPDARFGQAWRH